MFSAVAILGDEVFRYFDIIACVVNSLLGDFRNFDPFLSVSVADLPDHVGLPRLFGVVHPLCPHYRTQKKIYG